jgi:hypothetical protein
MTCAYDVCKQILAPPLPISLLLLFRFHPILIWYSEFPGSPLGDVVERVNDIMMSVVESEECMERIACELGGLANDVGLRDNTVTK